MRLLLALLLALLATSAEAAPWKPAPGMLFDIQFTAPMNLDRKVQLIDLDLFDTTKQQVSALRAKGVRIACYLNAGAWEDWRPDKGSFPKAVLGRDYDGWPGERWLDIRRIDLLAPIMRKRLDLCKSKGFDTVEPDNVNGYGNPTGFPLKAGDQLAYNRWLADEAHARGLSIGLKNDLEQAQDLVGWYDWALVESCFTYDECGHVKPFIRAGKAVWVIEYKGNTSSAVKKAADRFCPKASSLGVQLLFKSWDLDGRLPARCGRGT